MDRDTRAATPSWHNAHARCPSVYLARHATSFFCMTLGYTSLSFALEEETASVANIADIDVSAFKLNMRLQS